MATVFISFSSEKYLQHCICCGEKATTSVRKRFSRFQWDKKDWLIPVLSYLLTLGGLIVYRAETLGYLDVPFCNSHKRYWLYRRLFFWFGMAYMVGAAVLVAAFERTRPVLAIIIGISSCVYLIALVVIPFRSIRAVRIDETGIRLTNASRRFAEMIDPIGEGPSRVVWCRTCNIPYTSDQIADGKCSSCGDTLSATRD